MQLCRLLSRRAGTPQSFPGLPGGPCRILQDPRRLRITLLIRLRMLLALDGPSRQQVPAVGWSMTTPFLEAKRDVLQGLWAVAGIVWEERRELKTAKLALCVGQGKLNRHEEAPDSGVLVQITCNVT